MSPSKTPTPTSTPDPDPDPLDPISIWRAWQTFTIIYTIQLNRQIHRRWLLEQQCMQDKPLHKRFRPLIFLEPVPTLQKPDTNPTPAKHAANNPFDPSTMNKIRAKAALLRARVEKGKEIASEIERRMVQYPPIRYPTHFCHTCVQDGEMVEVLLTKCGHRVCRTCLEFGVNGEGVYECSICFVPTGFVARSQVGLERDYSAEDSSILKGHKGDGDGEWELSEVLFADY
ncbi:Zinc finger RING-type [Penicillium expansum]|nr:Zinc finger RING-type [Penicillium expansum]